MANIPKTTKDAKPVTTEVVATVEETEVVKLEPWQMQWYISNNTPSVAAFPELGEQSANTIAPYTTNIPVTFKNGLMFESFNNNLEQLRELCRWDEVRGVLLHDTMHNEDKTPVVPAVKSEAS